MPPVYLVALREAGPPRAFFFERPLGIFRGVSPLALINARSRKPAGGFRFFSTLPWKESLGWPEARRCRFRPLPFPNSLTRFLFAKWWLRFPVRSPPRPRGKNDYLNDQ